MSDLRNIYGKNVSWFCLEGAVSLEEYKQEGSFLLDDEFEVYGENEDGQEGSVSIDVIKLLESAHARIDELESQPTIADYLEANKEMIDKTGCKVVTIASLKKFVGLDD